MNKDSSHNDVIPQYLVIIFQRLMLPMHIITLLKQESCVRLLAEVIGDIVSAGA